MSDDIIHYSFCIWNRYEEGNVHQVAMNETNGKLSNTGLDSCENRVKVKKIYKGRVLK